MQVSVSWQLLEEVPVDPQGSCSSLHPVIGPVLQVGDAEKPGFFFQSQQAGPMFHSLVTLSPLF